MGFELSTQAILDALRTTIGASVLFDGVLFTWEWKLEGPPLRWMAVAVESPMMMLEPGEVTFEPAGTGYMVSQDIYIHVVVPWDKSTFDKAYYLARGVGEKLLATIMSADKYWGLPWLMHRNPIVAGIDYEVNQIAQDHEVVVYTLGFNVGYRENDPGT